jgi:hypothetical protein
MPMLGRGPSSDSSGDPTDDKLKTSFELSYGNLGVEEKQMFVEAATFSFRKRAEYVCWGWSTIYTSAEMSWTTLLSKSLVKEVSFPKPSHYSRRITEVQEIWVHEKLRDLVKDFRKGAIMTQFISGDDLQRERFQADLVSFEQTFLGDTRRLWFSC